VASRNRYAAASLLAAALCAAAFSLSCGKAPEARKPGARVIVATYSLLGSIASELVGDSFEVRTAIPNGLDPHEWEPSAKDIHALQGANLVVENGLGLEEGMSKALQAARAKGIRFFTATDHVAVRIVGAGEGLPTGDRDQAVGAKDPHIWTDPEAMKAVAAALAAEIGRDFGIDLSARLSALETRLDSLDAEIGKRVVALPPGERKLATGHESLGYFAQRYGFKLVGAVVPSLSSEAESSAADIAELKRLIAANGVKVLFVETGTPERVVATLAAESHVRAVRLVTHALPRDGSYFSFMRDLAGTIVDALEAGQAKP
jgi:zinc/manganese transport system substrate-binding protein